MTDTRILERVRKLLQLSKRAGTEQEAANAAAYAARLVEQHEIHEAELRNLDDPAAIKTPEPIDVIMATTTRRCVAWHANLAGGLADKLHCHHHFRGGKIAFFGRLSAIQTASYTLAYLIRQVDQLCDEACKGRSRGYRNAFRVGCSSRIAARLRETCAHAVDVEVDTAAVPTPPPSAGVLAIIKKDRDEVAAAYEEHSKGFRTVRIGAYSSGSGYAAGKAAGDRAHLGGGGRAGLPKGQGVLP